MLNETQPNAGAAPLASPTSTETAGGTQATSNGDKRLSAIETRLKSLEALVKEVHAATIKQTKPLPEKPADELYAELKQFITEQGGLIQTVESRGFRLSRPKFMGGHGFYGDNKVNKIWGELFDKLRKLEYVFNADTKLFDLIELLEKVLQDQHRKPDPSPAAMKDDVRRLKATLNKLKHEAINPEYGLSFELNDLINSDKSPIEIDITSLCDKFSFEEDRRTEVISGLTLLGTLLDKFCYIKIPD